MRCEMATNLEELKKELYGVFNFASETNKNWFKNETGEKAIQNRLVMVNAANTIANIEREQREAAASKPLKF